ncbi:MAG TPA: hypothetical protein DIT40_03140 [Alphaproteobacteria bacterium]|nr:hypothetical protein [Alphaproteobacteria bacterium]
MRIVQLKFIAAKFILLSMLGLAVTLLTDGQAAAQPQPVGKAEAVVRVVEGSLNTDTRRIRRSDEVFSNEVIATRADSASKIRFLDDTMLTVGPDSKVTLDEFVYDPKSQNSKMVINTAIGVARFVTGKMGSASYKIATPTATIGVRGTVFTVFVAANGATSIVVENGAVNVTGQNGLPVDVPAGLATNVQPGEPPSDPAPPDADTEAQIAEMDVTLLLGGEDSGGSGGGSDSPQDGEEELLEIMDETEELREAGCGC